MEDPIVCEARKPGEDLRQNVLFSIMVQLDIKKKVNMLERELREDYLDLLQEY